MQGRLRKVPRAGVQAAGWDRGASEAGTDQDLEDQGGNRVRGEGTNPAGHRRKEGTQDQEGTEEGVRIAAHHKAGRSLAEMEVVGGSRVGLDRLPEVAEGGLGEGSVPIQVPAQGQVVARPISHQSVN